MMQAQTQPRNSADRMAYYVPESRMLVTMHIGGQLFGIPVLHVQDVLRAQRIARVPLAPPEMAGLINLRGRIVTVIDMRRRLGLPAMESGAPHMFVVVERQGDLFSLVVDSVGEVLTVPVSQIESAPANLQGSWREMADGVCRLEGELLVIIGIKTLLDI